jgi:hypothetical protein
MNMPYLLCLTKSGGVYSKTRRLAEHPGAARTFKLASKMATLGDYFSKYRDQWANELHPTDPGFEALPKRFEQALSEML